MNNIPLSENLKSLELIGKLIQNNLLLSNISSQSLISELALLSCLTPINNTRENNGLNSIASSLFTQYSTNLNQGNLNWQTNLNIPKPQGKIFTPRIIINDQPLIKQDLLNQEKMQDKCGNLESTESKSSESALDSIKLKRASSICESTVKEIEKKIYTSRRNSYSTDQGTQDIDKLENPKVPESSLIFIIRRYSKRHQRFILLTRHRNLITKCEHIDEEYYAKGMCKNCYHNKGERSKFATKCGHNDRFHYARGLCKGCYLSKYHKNKKTKALDSEAHL